MTAKLKIAGETGTPYPDDPTYLQAELDWLAVRVKRIVAERRAQEAAEEESDGDPAHAHRPGRTTSREARCRVVELGQREKKLRDEIDARLDLNRRQRDAHTLGLDVVCTEASLGAEERVVLLALLASAVSQPVAERVLGELCHHWGAVAVSDLISVLDPQDLAEHLRFRRLFHPNGPLVSHGLVLVGKPSGEPTASGLPSWDVSLSLDAFARIIGDPDAATEGD